MEALVSSAPPVGDVGTSVRHPGGPSAPRQLVLAIGRCDQATSSPLTIASPWSLAAAPFLGAPEDRRSTPLCVPDHLADPAEARQAPITTGAGSELANAMEHERWIGDEPRSVTIGGEAFALRWCFIGSSSADPDNPTVIDRQLELAPKVAAIAPVLKQLASYAGFSPAERRAYLEWINTGRASPSPPRPFVLLFVSSLEHAILRDGLDTPLAKVRDELSRLDGLCEQDPVSATAIRRLLTLCELIDPDFVPAPIPATVAANFRDKMPFEVRHFLGWMLRNAGRLEADGGLLFYLQQPGCRLKPHESQYFRELHAAWCLRYADASIGAFPDPATLPRLALAYEPLVGEFGRTFTSDLPDLGALGVPTALEVLFRECSEPLAHLRNEPVGRIPTNVSIPVTTQGGNGDVLNWRVGAAAALNALVTDSAPRSVTVAELLAIMLEAPETPARKLLPKRLGDGISRRLDEEGFGFEPDNRSGFPPSLRCDRRITLFRTGRTDHQKPSEAYLLAQAAVVVSGAAQHWYPSLRPLAPDEVEGRLPFRHRFTDAEHARLYATAVAIATLDERPRTFVGRWIKRLARARRIDHLLTGFGMAFRGQRRNGELAKLARALVVECQSLISVDEMLAAAADLAVPDECFHRTLESRVEALQSPPLEASLMREPGEAFMSQAGEPGSPLAPLCDVPAAFEGLDGRHAELLLALHDRPRTHAELGELARSRRLSLAAAVARINEWALLSFDADAISDGEELMISLAARQFLDQRIEKQ